MFGASAANHLGVILAGAFLFAAPFSLPSQAGAIFTMGAAFDTAVAGYFPDAPIADRTALENARAGQ